MNLQHDPLANLYLMTVISRFKEIKQLADKALQQLSSESDWHYAPAPDSNSIAIIIKHMSGNMISRWTDLLTTDGEKTNRDRDGEFTEEKLTVDQLRGLWEHGWDVFLSTLHQLKPEHLTHTIMIRQKPLTVLDAIDRQMSHYSYHVGQIVYLCKYLTADQWHSLSIPKKK